MPAIVSGRHIIVVGDTSTHGGKIITGDPNVTINGIPMARIGDLHACPQYWGDTPHGVRPILPVGCVSVRGLILGRKTALSDDMTSCGAKIISSQNMGASSC
jgi:uncharacterized Zn-binding protein involved in type VI secretion